jgi:hypothetical protein
MTESVSVPEILKSPNSTVSIDPNGFTVDIKAGKMSIHRTGSEFNTTVISQRGPKELEILAQDPSLTDRETMLITAIETGNLDPLWEAGFREHGSIEATPASRKLVVVDPETQMRYSLSGIGVVAKDQNTDDTIIVMEPISHTSITQLLISRNMNPMGTTYVDADGTTHDNIDHTPLGVNILPTYKNKIRGFGELSTRNINSPISIAHGTFKGRDYNGEPLAWGIERVPLALNPYDHIPVRTDTGEIHPLHHHFVSKFYQSVRKMHKTKEGKLGIAHFQLHFSNRFLDAKSLQAIIADTETYAELSANPSVRIDQIKQDLFIAIKSDMMHALVSAKELITNRKMDRDRLLNDLYTIGAIIKTNYENSGIRPKDYQNFYKQNYEYMKTAYIQTKNQRGELDIEDPKNKFFDYFSSVIVEDMQIAA